MKALPKKFTVTITEEDRQKAGRFCEGGSCLLATAVRRHLKLTPRRFIHEGLWDIAVGQHAFAHAYFGTDDANVDKEVECKPFYRRAVVGKRITFTRRT